MNDDVRAPPCLLLAGTCLAAPAFAQTAPPPRFQEVDDNGVDLISGRFVFSLTEGTIGSGDGMVTLSRGHRDDYSRTDEWSGLLYRRTINGTPHMVVQFGGRSETFSISGSTYTVTTGSGSTLVGSGGGYTYTAKDGTTIGCSSSSAAIGGGRWTMR